jgi:hypothetical protein
MLWSLRIISPKHLAKIGSFYSNTVS